ncbi:MAG: ABC transporter substrate-binding protein [Armatimonadota bacterium]|nr:ABC transporter substrate-binding protein [Armatimonadota bacterium]
MRPRLAVVVLLAALFWPFGTGGFAAPARDTLVYVSDISDMISLDPAVAYEFSGILVAQNVYDTLVAFEGEDLSTLKPRLATSWRIRDAGSAWKVTFKLRPGVRFSTGRPLTARAVAFSLDRVIALNKSPAFLLKDVAGLKEGDTKAIGNDTVEVTLPKTASPQAFLSILTFTVGAVVDPEEALAHQSGTDRGEAWLRNHSAGTGPYRLERWDAEARAVLVANPNYWGPRPKVSRVIIQHVPETSTQKFMVASGDADIAANLTPEQAREMAGDQNVKIQRGKLLQLVYIGMNVKHPPLDKAQVREAIRWSIDYDGIVRNLLRGEARKVQTIIPEGLFGFNPATPFQQNPARAKALLREAGLGGGFTVELLVPTGPAPGGVKWSDIAAKVQSDLAKSGITLQIKETAQAQLLNIYRAQKGQMVLILWGPDFPDPDGNATPFTDFAAKSIAWRNQYDDPVAARLAKQAALETNRSRRLALYKQLTDRVLHEGPYVVLYQPTTRFALRKGVQGFVWNPMAFAEFRTVSK